MHSQGVVIPTRYKILRALLRIWFALFFRRVRLLPGDASTPSGPAIYLVSHPASFLDALLLVASFERRIHCLLDRKLISRGWRGRLARGLSMTPYDPTDQGRRSALETCRNLLARGEVMVLFSEPHRLKLAGPPGFSVTAATLALEADARQAGESRVAIFPVHLYLPVARAHTSELLIHVDSPVEAREFAHRPAGEADGVRALARALEERCRGNAFRLQRPDVAHFLSDLEEVLRADLEEEWAARPNWKQKVEGFELSRFLAEWVEQLNYLHPGRLVALRESLDAHREARRQWSLRSFEVETAGAWLKSPWRRTAAWVESMVGLPIACYGLINHLVIWLVLFWAGLLKKPSGRDATVEWVGRALVVLGCYAGQIFLGAHFLGRAAAGYYAPSLPVSGLGLWRYSWLLRHRTRLLLLALYLPHQDARLRRRRKKFIDDLDREIRAYAETLGIPH